MTPPAGGFTLVEAIVALTLSSVLVLLVGTTFLVQNRYYARQLALTTAQDNARMVTEMVASELRSLTDSAVVLAQNQRLVIRSPMVMGVVCSQGSGNKVNFQMRGGAAGLTTSEVTGFGIRTSTGRWEYYDISSWGQIENPGGSPAADCAANGADTVGIRDEFVRLQKIKNYAGYLPANGTVMMIYRTVEYKIQTSTMDPTTLGLYRGIYGETLVELATGLDSTAGFQYRTGGSTYASSVSGAAALGTIDAIRINARAKTRPQAGLGADVTYGWGVNVHLRNGR